MTIRSLWLKVALVAVVVPAAYFGLGFLARQVSDPARLALGSVVTLLLFALGVRFFRGSNEARQRPFWRATGGVPSGFVVAGIALLFAIAGLASSFGAHESAVDIAIPLAIWLVVAIFYIHSSVRLLLIGQGDARGQAKSEPNQSK